MGDYNILDIDSLAGLEVQSAHINEENDLIQLNTNRGTLYLSWVGDCCAQCFLAHVSGTQFLIDATILSAEHSEWVDTSDSNREEGYVIESMGTTIKTSKGTVTFESRVSHNGYYGGWIRISDIPLDQYDDKIEDFSALRPLEDF